MNRMLSEKSINMQSLSRNKIVMLMTICMFGLSCKDGNGHVSDKKDSVFVSKDSIIIRKDSISGKLPDIEYPKDFVELKKEFRTDPAGKVDSDREISLTLVHYFLKDFDSTFYTSVNPIASIVNDAGYFYIIKENCTAGGNCAVYLLFAFDKTGKFTRSRRIGRLIVDESDIITFNQKVVGDTVLTAYETDYDIEKGVVTKTTSKNIKLKL
jgi:hypothetical protein